MITEKQKAAQKAWRAKNPGYNKEWYRKARAANPEKYNKAQREWRSRNPQRSKEIDAKKYENGKERNRASKMLASARDRAKLKVLAFDLTLEDIQIPEYCPVFKCKIDSKNQETRPELDRVVPSKGYVKGNVRVISGRANRLKSDGLLEEFEALVEYLRSNPSP